VEKSRIINLPSSKWRILIMETKFEITLKLAIKAKNEDEVMIVANEIIEQLSKSEKIELIV